MERTKIVWWRFVLAAGCCAAVFGLADLIFSWNPLAAAPYLAHRQEAVFRSVPLLPVGGLIAETVNGWVTTIVFAATMARTELTFWQKGLWLSLALWGFWVISGTMTAFVWLQLPPSVALANVAWGLPKSLAIGIATAWLWRHVVSTAASERVAP